MITKRAKASWENAGPALQEQKTFQHQLSVIQIWAGSSSTEAHERFLGTAQPKNHNHDKP